MKEPMGLVLEGTGDVVLAAVSVDDHVAPGAFVRILGRGGAPDALALVRRVRWSGGIFTEATAGYHLQHLDDVAVRQRSAVQLLELAFIASVSEGRPLDRRARSLPAGSLVAPVPGPELARFLDLESPGMAIGVLSSHRDLRVELPWDEIAAGHIGIVGQTGSGKTNVLRLFHHALARRRASGRSERSYIVFDFHDEFEEHPDEHVLVPPFQFGPQDLRFEVLSELLPGLSVPQEDALHLALDRRPGGLHALVQAVLQVPGPEATKRVLQRRIERLARTNAFSQDADIGSRISGLCSKQPAGIILRLGGVQSHTAGVLIASVVRQVLRDRMASPGPPIMLVVDEAHRLMSATSASVATRSFRFVAQEGRKFGVTLTLATQRPSLVDATILSQCGMMFALRLTAIDDARSVTQVLGDVRPGELGTLGVGQGIVSRRFIPETLWVDFARAPARRPAADESAHAFLPYDEPLFEY